MSLENAVRNDAGEIAVQHTRQVPFRTTINGTMYIWSIRANISLAWIQEEHVPRILSIMGGCCGQTNKRVNVLANEDTVRRWTNNGGR